MLAPLHYLRCLAWKTADDILNGLCQVTALLPKANDEGVQLLAPKSKEDGSDQNSRPRSNPPTSHGSGLTWPVNNPSSPRGSRWGWMHQPVSEYSVLEVGVIVNMEQANSNVVFIGSQITFKAKIYQVTWMRRELRGHFYIKAGEAWLRTQGRQIDS